MYLLFIVTLLPIVIAGNTKTNELPSNIQCSVFPGSKPKCFPPTKDLLTSSSTKPVKEFTSTSSRIINHCKHGTFYVGTDSKEEIGSENDVSTCNIITDRSLYYDEKYRTNIKSNDDEDLKSWFITTRREVWKCENEQKESFYRIVTELLSTQAVPRVHFYNGIEVTRIPIPFDNSEVDSPQLYTTVIREIKYIVNDKVVQYKGSLKFSFNYLAGILTGIEGAKPYNVFIQRHTSESAMMSQSSTSKPEHEIIYSDFRLKAVKITEGNRLSSKAFREEMPFVNTYIGTFEKPSKALCGEIKEAEPDFRLVEHLPLWSFSEKTKDVGPDGEISWTQVPARDFLIHFVVTKHLVWKCKVNGGTYNNEQFYRTEIEYVGKEEIDTVEVYDGTTVFEYALTMDTKSIGIRQIIYFTHNSPRNRLKYYGTAKLKVPISERFKKWLKGLVQSWR